MNINKGDLVLVTDGERVSTCIILTVKYSVGYSEKDSFYYSYCLETGLYGIIYQTEILTVVAEDFAPDFEFHSEIFNSAYDALYDFYAYWPYPEYFQESEDPTDEILIEPEDEPDEPEEDE